LGVSAYQRSNDSDLDLDDPNVVSIREAMGGQLAPTPYTQVRWFLKDLEFAQTSADSGDLSMAARLWNAAKRDGVLAGVLSTRTGGLVRLPRKFRGAAYIVKQLELGHESVRSVFDEMFPPAELAALVDDGIGLGVGVAELVPVQGRDYPVMVRLPPENLVYWWVKNQWFYRSVAGLIPITPGDGRWILHIPGGRIAPWQSGMWRAVGRAFINKEHALLHDQNWQAKLANPARVAKAPAGATDEQSQAWFKKVMAWGVNTVFGLKPGWEVALLESNGRGHESFDKTVQRSEREFIICIAGQEVTTDGGAGFSNANIHKAIRADLIKATADALAYTINTQGIPPWVANRWGEAALATSPCVEWDVTPPTDRANDANALVQLAAAIKGLDEAFAAHNQMLAAAGSTVAPTLLDLSELTSRFSCPVQGDLNGDGVPDSEQRQPPKLTLVSDPDDDIEVYEDDFEERAA
jgi:hypothetical protein